MSDAAAAFDALRLPLLRIAYRMLGSMADAEDVVQDAWLRWADADRQAVRVPEAFLRRVVTRLCLDQLKSARVRREEYVGPWLPDPVVEPDAVEDVTLPLMLALERLSPLERAHGLEIAQVFFAASRSGEIGRLGAMLAEDVSLYSDGGGKRPAAARVMLGWGEVTRTFAAIARLTHGRTGELIRYAYVNGLPGFITREPDGILQTTALLIENDRVRAIYVMRNPDKLRHLEGRLN